MSAGIEVKEFKHIPGVNDAEYIKKLEELREIDKGIINTAVAKIKKLSAQLSAQPEIKKDGDTISRQAAIDALERKLAEPYHTGEDWYAGINCAEAEIYGLPSAQPEYKPVKAEDFAKTMSENTLYGFMAWHGEALELMERHGFVICKKTM